MNRKLIASLVASAVLMSIASCTDTYLEEMEITETTIVSETAETTVAETTEAVEETSAIPDFDLSSVPTFDVTSENWTDGVWDDIISNTSRGENLSPELSWEEVSDAGMYVIYMVDTSANNWMHMKVRDITTNSVSLGDFSGRNYIGPYPPSGTHDYVVYVFALRSSPLAFRGSVDNVVTSLSFVFNSLDVNEAGETGNVISYGTLTGTFTA